MDAQKRHNGARLSRDPGKNFLPKCELPHTSRPIPDRCCLRLCLRALIWRMRVYTSDKYHSAEEKMRRIPRRLYLLLVLACSGAVPAQAKETRNIHFSIPL